MSSQCLLFIDGHKEQDYNDDGQHDQGQSSEEASGRCMAVSVQHQVGFVVGIVICVVDAAVVRRDALQVCIMAIVTRGVAVMAVAMATMSIIMVHVIVGIVVVSLN